MLRKTIHLVILYFLLVLLFSGCDRLSQESQPSDNDEPSMSEPTVHSEPPYLTYTPGDNGTLTEATADESVDAHWFRTKCVELVKDISESQQFPGKLVLGDSLFDLTTLKLFPFNAKGYDHTCCISPDRTRLVLYSTENHSIAVVDNQGIVLKEFNNLSLVPIYWLNNQQLILEKQPWSLMVDGDPIYPDYGEHSFILDTQSASVTELDLEFNDFSIGADFLGQYWDYASVTRTSINSASNFLVYPAVVSENHQSFSEEIVLWDIQEEREVLRFSTSRFLSLPVWNSTGTKFLISAPPEFSQGESGVWVSPGSELFTVDVKGTIQRLTHLTDVTEVFEYDYSWSPDDTKIAFRIQFPDEGLWGWPYGLFSIAISDSSTGHVDNLCIKGNAKPIWSPDGRYLAIKGSEEDDSNQNFEQIIIIDLFENTAYTVLEPGFYSILGWLN